jgi:dienelactone hydrolase
VASPGAADAGADRYASLSADAALDGTVLGSPDADGASEPVSSPDASLAWLSDTTVAEGQGIVIEKVTYASGSLRVLGQVCRPDDTARHALVMVNHGGFSGNTDVFAGNLSAPDSFCINAARDGFVVGESSYRGEDGSDGRVEVCLGEVDDVVAMLAVLRGMPYVDPARVAAFGGSHGGCITTQLALRDPTLRAAVDFFGPGDLAPLDAWWHDQLAQGEPAPFCASLDGGPSPCIAVHESLIGTVETAAGGPPSSATTAAYDARSPAPRLGSLTVPMAFFQGTDDALIAVGQVCEKRSALTAAGHAPLAWYLDTSLSPASPSTVCGGGFRTDPVPSTASATPWAGPGPYLFVYQGQGHGFTGAASNQANAIALQFLVAHLM